MGDSPNADRAEGTPQMPDTEPDSGGSEGVTIPKARFDQVNGQLKAEREQREALQREIEMLREQKQNSKAEPAPQPPQKEEEGPGQAVDIEALVERATQRVTEQLGGQVTQLSIQQRLGLSPEQSEVVGGLMSQHSLSEAEAVELARLRKPDLFEEQGKGDYRPDLHGGTPARGTSAMREPETEESRRKKVYEAIDGAQTVHQRNDLVRQEVNRRLAPYLKK